MAVFSTIAAVAGIVGVGVQAYGAYQQSQGNKKAEALRLRQQNLESARARRSTIRQAIIARSQALSSGTAQGAEGSSGLAGGLGQVQAQAGSNIQGINQGQSIGYQMFQANSQISSGQTMQSVGQGLSGFGDFLNQNYETLRRTFRQGVPA